MRDDPEEVERLLGERLRSDAVSEIIDGAEEDGEEEEDDQTASVFLLLPGIS